MYDNIFVGVERYDDDGDVWVRDDTDVAILLCDGEAFVSDDTGVPRDGGVDGAKLFPEKRFNRLFLSVLCIGMFEPSLPVRKRFSR